MDFISVLDKLSTDGVRVEVAFEQKSIQHFLMWGVGAAIVAGIVVSILKKAIG